MNNDMICEMIKKPQSDIKKFDKAAEIYMYEFDGSVETTGPRKYVRIRRMIIKD